MKKSVIALIIPAVLALTSCSFFENLSNNNNKNVPEVEKEYTKNVVKYDGNEKNKDEFLKALPNRKALSDNDRGYNFGHTTYKTGIEKDIDVKKKHGVRYGFFFELTEESGNWVWKIDSYSELTMDKGQNEEDFSDDFIIPEPQDIVSSRSKDSTKYYVGKDTFSMVHHYKEEQGSTSYYYRFEIKWNKNGDIIAVDNYEASAIAQDDNTFVESIVAHHNIEYDYKMTSNAE